MEPTTAKFVAQNLEKVGRLLAAMQALLESDDVDQESLCDVLAWALSSAQVEVFAAANVVRDYAKAKLSTSEQSPSQATLTPERLEQIKHEVEQAAQVGKQALEEWRSQNQQQQ